jgi:branched-chain amino acid transport system substrate-binding protein
LRTRPRTLGTLLLAVPLALTVAACSGSGSSGPSNANAKTVSSGSAVVIGATLSLTGTLGALGQPLAAGYRQEIADVNAAGGIAVGGSREKLKLVVLDNGSDPSRAAAQATELVRADHAVALLGSATA